MTDSSDKCDKTMNLRMTMPLWICASLCGVVTGLFGLGGGLLVFADAEPPRVTFPPLVGKDGSRCARQLSAEAKRSRVKVGNWLGPSLPATGGFKRVASMLTLVPFDLVIEGQVRENHVVLRAYRTRPSELVGLLAIRTGGRCQFDRPGLQLLDNWLNTSVLPRLAGGEPYMLKPTKKPRLARPIPQTSTTTQFVEALN